MKTRSLLLALLLLTRVASAQHPPVLVLDDTGRVLLKDTTTLPPDWTPKTRGLAIFFNQGFLLSNPRGLNQRLAAAGYPELGTFQLFWGAGATYRMGRYMVGGELNVAVNMFGPRGNDLAQVRRSTHVIHLYNAFSVYRDSHRRIYPLLGLSGTLNDLFITRATPVTDFTNTLTRQGNAASISHVETGINLGIGYDVVMESKRASPYVSLQLIYRYGDLTPWHSIYNDFTNPPFDRMNGIYLQLRLGYSWHKARGGQFWQ